MKRILLFLLIISSLYAQDAMVFRPPTLSSSESIPSLFVQGTTESDSILLTVNTRQVELDSVYTASGTIATIYDSVVAYGDSLWCYVTLDVDTVGLFTDTVYFVNTGLVSPVSEAISFSVTGSYDLLVEDSVTFSSTKLAVTDYMYLYNVSSTQSMTNITYSGISPTSPFSISDTVNSLNASSGHDVAITFSSPIVGTWIDTLIVTSDADNSPDSCILTGIWAADTFVTSSEWLASSPGGGGWWQGIKLDPVSKRVHLVGDLGGHFYSDDLGVSWTASSGFQSYEHADVDVLPGGDTVLVATAGGIYRSVDGGENFTREGVGEIYSAYTFGSSDQNPPTDTMSFNIGAINHHPANSQIVFAGNSFPHQTSTEQGGVKVNDQGDTTDARTNPCKIYRSLDGGATWTTIAGYNDPNGFEVTLNSIGGFAGPTNDASVVYVTSYEGVYKSNDTGNTWTRVVGTGWPDGYVLNTIAPIAVHPTQPDTVWVGSRDQDNQLWYTEDGGTTWENRADEMGYTAYDLRFKELRYSSSGDSLFIANDEGGATGDGTDAIPWSHPSLFMYDQSLTDTTVPYFSVWSDLAYSFTDTTTWFAWNRNSNGNPTSHAISYFDMTPGYDTVVSSLQFVNVTTDGGQSWVGRTSEKQTGDWWKSRGIEILVINDVEFDPTDADIIHVAVSDQEYITSQDGGVSWTSRNLGTQSGTAVAVDPSNTDKVYLATVDGSGVARASSYIWRSDDGGDTFTEVQTASTSNQLGGANIRTLTVNKDGRVFAGSFFNVGTNGLYYSDDDGVTWTNGYGTANVTDIQIYQGQTNPDIMFFTASRYNNPNDRGLMKSVNEGQSWTSVKIANVDSFASVQSVAIHPTNPDYLFVAQLGTAQSGGYTTGRTAVYRTTDGGTNWTLVLSPDSNDGLSDHYEAFSMVRFDPTNDSTIYVSTTRAGWRMDHAADGMFMSSDSGNTWSKINYNLERKNITAFDVNVEGSIWAGGPGTGGWMLNKVASAAPTINSIVTTEDFVDTTGTFTINFSHNGNVDVAAVSGYSLDSNSITYTETMTLSANNTTASFDYDFSEDVVDTVFYVRGIVSNAFGADTTATDSLDYRSPTTTTSYDTFYVAQGTDDTWIQSGSLNYNLTYLRIARWTSNKDTIGVRFTGITEESGLQEAWLEVYTQAADTDTILLRTWAEDNGSPVTFTNDAATFRTRYSDSTSASADTTITTAWSDNTYYRVATVTSVVQELFTSYSYNNGSMAFYIGDDGSAASKARLANSYDSENDGTLTMRLILKYLN